MAFSPNGQILATASDDNTAKLWDVQSGLEIRTIGLSDRVMGVAFSPDGNRLVLALADSTAKLYDIEGGGLTLDRTLAGHTDVVATVAYSPDGAYIATGSYDHTTRLWSTATGNEERTYTRASNKQVRTQELLDHDSKSREKISHEFRSV